MFHLLDPILVTLCALDFFEHVVSIMMTSVLRSPGQLSMVPRPGRTAPFDIVLPTTRTGKMSPTEFLLQCYGKLKPLK